MPSFDSQITDEIFLHLHPENGVLTASQYRGEKKTYVCVESLIDWSVMHKASCIIDHIFQIKINPR